MHISAVERSGLRGSRKARRSPMRSRRTAALAKNQRSISSRLNKGAWRRSVGISIRRSLASNAANGPRRTKTTFNARSNERRARESRILNAEIGLVSSSFFEFNSGDA